MLALGSRLSGLGGQCCLVFLIAFSNSANALTQCSFNQPLYFDPSLFPSIQNGYDGNSYSSENAALTAARQAYFGPAGIYPTQSVAQACSGKYISMNLSLVAGGGAGEIAFFDYGIVPLAYFPGASILVVSALRGLCDNSGSVASTRSEVYAPGYILTCSASAPLQLAVNGLTETRPAGTAGSSTITITGMVTSSGTPQPGVALGFSVDVTANSGGHEHHDVARPQGTLGGTQVTTDANGEAKVTFTAPEVAGIHTIKATCATCSNSPATKEIQVKVPDLLPISPSAPQNADGTFVYALTSVDKTHQGNGRYHHNQYYLTQQSRQNLRTMVEAFTAEGWGTVALNDASLFWGGRYDIYGHWGQPASAKEPHAGHREGREIDVSFARASNPVSASKQKVFYDKFCKDKKVSFPFSILHHYVLNPHFHVYLEKQTACWKSEK